MLFSKLFTLFVVLIVLSGVATAESTLVKATNTWMGSNADETLAKEMPENGVITNAMDFDKLIKAWKVAEKTPEVDFDTELVLVSTTRGGRLTLNASFDDTGNLKVGGIATRDLRPGFRYVIISVPRKGIKTVNGKELPK